MPHRTFRLRARAPVDYVKLANERSSTKAPTSKPCHIDKLPAELRIAILSHLPVKQVLAARLLSKDFNALIRDPTNDRMIARVIAARERQRINAEVQRLCFIPVDTKDENGLPIAYLNAVRDFIDLRGIQVPVTRKDRQRDRVKYIYDVFVHYWLQRCEEHHATVSSHPWHALRPKSMEKVLTRLMHFHAMENHISRTDAMQIRTRGGLTVRQDLEQNWDPRLLGVNTKEQIVSVCDILASSSPKFLPNAKIFRSDDEVEAYDTRPEITRVVDECYYMSFCWDAEWMSSRKAGMDALCRDLGIDAVPLNAPYGYTVQTKRRHGIQRQFKKRHQVGPDTLRKAMVLEDLYIS